MALIVRVGVLTRCTGKIQYLALIPSWPPNHPLLPIGSFIFPVTVPRLLLSMRTWSQSTYWVKYNKTVHTIFLYLLLNYIYNRLTTSSQLTSSSGVSLIPGLCVHISLSLLLSLCQCVRVWLRECQECAKLSSRQRVAALKNLKHI